MGSVTNLQGLPYPVGTDAPDGPGQILASMQAAEKKAVQVYSSAAARTAAFTSAGVSPTEGMTSFLQDVNRLETYTGTYWGPVAGYEWTYVEVTDNADAATAGAAVTTVAGLATPSFTLPGQRAVVVRTHCLLQSTVSGDVALLTLTDSANVAFARSGDIGLVSAGRFYLGEFGQRLILPAGTYSFKTRRQRISGTGAVSAPSNAADVRNWIQVIDFGPA